MKKTIAVATILLATATTAKAHVSFVNLGTYGGVGGSITSPEGTAFKRYGWSDAADANLGDSHQIGPASAKWYRFTLTQDATVDISFIQTTVGLDPAFSLYRGAFNLNAHDETATDPLNPVDAFFHATYSETDRRPDDPLIAHYVWDDATHSVLSVNSAWTQTFAGSGGLTAEQWYAANYTPHNGYRDTLNGTLAGGIDTDPGPPNYGNLLHPYVGQFDPFGSWSMADTAEQESSVQYVTSVSGTSDSFGDQTWGGNGNHNTAIGTGETLLGYLLTAGTYTIAASGEACTSCTSTNFKGTMSLTVHPVPLPAAFWLMLSALGSLGLLRRKSS